MNFIKITEQPSIHEDLEQKSVRELLEGINEEDRKVASAVHACIPQIEKLVNEIVERMHQGGRIFYLGAGTSGRLGVLDASEIPATFGMPDTCVIGIIAGGEQALKHPVESAEDNSQKGWMELQKHHITNKDILIGIAASGTTPYVIGALQKAREHGILTASISSNLECSRYTHRNDSRSGIYHRQLAHEERHRAKNDTEYDKYHRHDKTRQSKRKPDGKHATQQSKTSRPRSTNAN